MADASNDVPLIDGAVYRLARKPWGCACPGNGHDKCPHPHCRQTIAPQTLYVEYVGSSGAYESGARYCLPCGVSEFSKDVAEKLPVTMTDPVDFDTSTDEQLELSNLVPRAELEQALAKINRVRIYATGMAESQNDLINTYGDQILAFLEVYDI